MTNMVLESDSQSSLQIGAVGLLIGLGLAVGSAVLSGSLSSLTSGIVFFTAAGLIIALLIANVHEWSRFLAGSESRERTPPQSGPDQSSQAEQNLDRLRDRYLSGELSEEQFEQKLQILLNTETLEDSREYEQRELEREG